MYNETVNAFFKRNDIDPEKISEKLDASVSNSKNIDPIIYNFGIYHLSIFQYVSIADIYGISHFDPGVSNNVFESLNSYYNDQEEGYLKRSCDELSKTPEEMLASDSFEVEPMKLRNLHPDEGIYIVYTNGLHRYSALRSLYLAELYKNPHDEDKLRKKYTIKAMVGNLDILKTYCHYVIKKTMPAMLEPLCDSTGQKIEKMLLITSDNEKKILTDDELLEFTRNLIEENPEFVNENLKDSNFRYFIDNIINKSKNNRKFYN